MKTLALIFVLFADLSYADQCQIIPAPIAYRAYRAIKAADTILDYCEPCGDLTPKPIVVSTVHWDYSNYPDYSTYAGVFVNNRNVDLAYTYIRTSASTFTNLSKLVGCHSERVTETIAYP